MKRQYQMKLKHGLGAFYAICLARLLVLNLREDYLNSAKSLNIRFFSE